MQENPDMDDFEIRKIFLKMSEVLTDTLAKTSPNICSYSFTSEH